MGQEAYFDDTESTEKRTVISTMIVAPESDAEATISGDDHRWPHWISYLNLQFILELGCFTPKRTSALRLRASNGHTEVWMLSPESTAQLAEADPAATAKFVAEWNRRTRFIDLPDPLRSLEQLFGELSRLAATAVQSHQVLLLREERYYPNRLD